MQNPILSLRQLVQEAAVASTPRKRVEGIVARVKAAMNVGVCSFYLADEEGNLTLMASEGLNPESVGKISLPRGAGLVGHVAEDQHPLNLESASEDPHYLYLPETGEERFEAFLGAPVVHYGDLIGVLVVEQQERRKFGEDEESFLVTVAAHLGLADPADFRPADDAESAGGTERTLRFKGVSGAPGVGIGTTLVLSGDTDLMKAPDVEGSDAQSELERFRVAVAATLEDLAAGQRKVAESVSSEVADLFMVYDLLLRSSDFSGEIETRIAGGKSAVAGLRAVVSECAARFESVDDDYLRARGEDIRNLGSRVYGRLRDAAPERPADGAKVVLVGGLVSIADIAAHPVEQLAGIVSMEGSTLSHTAVLAKALGIPAVMGVGQAGAVPKGAAIIVDGYHGQIIINPGPNVLEEFSRLVDFEKSLLAGLSKLRDLPGETPDGVRVKLYANTGLLADISPGLQHGAEGIGLYRSEIPFMLRESFPSEDEQVEVYRTVLSAYAGMPVCMRTLDVGGDKPLPYYPFREENPALGWRGVRFTLDNTVVFMTQIRAMLRAAAETGNLQIMIPMVASVSEVESFLLLLDSACRQCAEEGQAVVRPKVGIMAEVPASLGILPFLAGKIDFVSIGSNDLSQYLLAVDRNNARVTRLFDHLHPAVLQIVERLVKAAKELGIPASVCGEMAADPCAAVLLLGMGIESLSMPAFSIPRIKWLLRTVTSKAAREQLEHSRGCAHPEQTRARLQEFLVAQGLGSLLEPEGDVGKK